MQFFDMFKLAYKALIDRKMRSVLTILGITVGSALASPATLRRREQMFSQYEMRADSLSVVQPALTS